jgi:hypothetical protein
MKILFCIIAFIVLTTLNFEYLINRQGSTMLLVLAALIEIGLAYFLLFIHIKKHLK